MKTKEPAALDELVSNGRAALERDDVVKLTALGPKALRMRIVEALRALGFEATKSVVRRPLAAQLGAALDGGAFIPLSSVGSFVRGGAAAEAKRAAAVLVEHGAARKVVRGTVETLVPRSARVLSRDDLTAARRRVDWLGKCLTKAAKRPETGVLHADFVEAVHSLLDELRSASATRSGDASSSEDAVDGGGPAIQDSATLPDMALRHVLAAVDATRDDAVGLSFIPRVIRHLGSQLTADAVRTLLLDAAERGLVELRPEGGMHRLTAEEIDMCLPGPQGTRLSWARRTEQRPA